MGSEVEIPNVPVVKTLTSPGENEDATAIIQRAIDEVSSLPLSGGFRGAILLKSGTYKILNELHINASGVVLRGEGADEGGTKLVAAGVKGGKTRSVLERFSVATAVPRRAGFF